MKNVYIVSVTWKDTDRWLKTDLRVFSEEKYAKDYCDIKNSKKYEDHSIYSYEKWKVNETYIFGAPHTEIEE